MLHSLIADFAGRVEKIESRNGKDGMIGLSSIRLMRSPDQEREKRQADKARNRAAKAKSNHRFSSSKGDHIRLRFRHKARAAGADDPTLAALKPPSTSALAPATLRTGALHLHPAEGAGW